MRKTTRPAITCQAATRRRLAKGLCPVAACAALLAASPARTAPRPDGWRLDATEAVIEARAARLRRAWPSRAGADATMQPALHGGSLLNDTLTVGAAGAWPSLTFSYATGPSGLDSVFFILGPADGSTFIVALFEQGQPASSGSVTFTAAGASPPSFSEPGKWSILRATVLDRSGNATTYTQHELARLFTISSLHVVNPGPVDFTPPVVQSGKVLTPVVSLSARTPLFKASIGATDDVSGTGYLTVFISPPGGFPQSSFQSVSRPARQGVFTTYDAITPGQPTGTWTIAGYRICDLAFNCTLDTDPADMRKVFGTNTFSVVR